MRKYMGGAAFAAGIAALALAPAGATAQSVSPPADACSIAGIDGRVVTLNLAPVAGVTLRPCIPSGVTKCSADSTYEVLRLPSNPLIRLQIASCKAPPA